MLFVISCFDKPDSVAMRAEHQTAHSAYLKKNDDIVFLTGPKLSDDGATNIGSLYIINVTSRKEANAFSENEPFTKAGLYSSVTITRMRKGHFHPERAE